MTELHNKRPFRALLAMAALSAILTGCNSAGAGGGGGGGGTSTCDESVNHKVEWTFTGDYKASGDSEADVSVFVVWGSSSGGFSQTYSEAEGNLTQPTLHTEDSVPGCSSATINLTALDSISGSDDNTTVTLENVEIGIHVDGTEVASETFNGTYDSGTVLPSSGALVVIVGQ